MNPICLVKNGLVFPIERLGYIERPFSFKISDERLGFPNQFLVKEDEQPIYFKRMRMKMKGNKMVDRYVHRFCVGVRRSDGLVEKHWIMPSGEYDCLNTEPDMKVS